MSRSTSRPGGWMTAVALAAGIAACAAAPACAGDAVRIAQAQPPGSIPGQDPDQPDDATDAAAVMVRVGRLENQIRTLTGQIEQLQHQNQTLQDSLRKLAQDVDFRFQDLQNKPGGAAPARPAPALKRGDAGDDTGVSVATGDGATPGVSVAETPLRTARAGGDAFNPASDPGAPGAPRPLGTTPPSQPLPAARTSQATGNAPLDLMQRPGARTADTTADPDPAVIAAPPAARNPDAVASLVPGGTREEYESDLGLFRQGQYDGAATALQSFVDKYPKDRLVPDAVFMLGESYSRLGRQREAAEQFLKLSTDYAKSARAPDALLRLGMSLNALGAKEQACATYQEVTRKYPAASTEVRAGVDRELKRARCKADG